jgi:HK97 family phage portal protein
MAFELIRKALGTNLPTLYQSNLPAVYNNPMIKPVGNEITFYPEDSGERFINKGYNLNDAIYSIVSKNAEKCGQVRFYHTRVKKSETKTLREYNALSKGVISRDVINELKLMKKAMVEDLIVDSKLSRLLNKPNRYQTQSEWIEQLVGYRELTGEANVWFNRGLTDGPPVEMLIIPKPHLLLRLDPNNPWEVMGFIFRHNNKDTPWSVEDVLMWKYPSYDSLNSTERFRGQAPLLSARILMQGMNEADERVAISNRNAGAAGLAFLKNLAKPTLEQSTDIRRQFNSAVNNAEMASKIAILGGEWGYINFGYSLDQLKILDQYKPNFGRLCGIFKTPPGIFAPEGTWDNQKQFERKWIYSKIAPNVYGLRDRLSEKLISEFDLDPERDLVDCDVMNLQELSEDLKDQVDAVKEAWWLSMDERRSFTGYDPLGTPESAQYYVPSGLTPLSELNMPVGGDLTQQMNDLNA